MKPLGRHRDSGRQKDRKISFCDTTLRDGEQACGVIFDKNSKIEIAKRLDQLGIDCIDVGFPAISSSERAAIKSITSLGLNARIVACCRPIKEEIDQALECNVDGIFTFVPTSTIQMKAKFGGADREIRNKLKRKAKEAVEYAKSREIYVGIGDEDATRTDLDYLLEVFDLVKKAGADLIAPADTVGIMTPELMKSLTEIIKKEIDIFLAMHCHNDYGLAVANTIAGVRGGADQVQGTINGIGERAGNAAIDELAVVLDQHYKCKTGIKHDHLTNISNLVSSYSGYDNSPLKPIVGQNAFSHESGIHVSSVLKDPSSYEPFPPSFVGNQRSLFVGKHSGKSILKHILNMNGIEPTNPELETLLIEIKYMSEISKSHIEV